MSVHRCQLYETTARSQTLQQQLFPFYSDIKLSVQPSTNERYHSATTIINTTTFGNSGKGPRANHSDLQELAAKLAEQYGQDTQGWTAPWGELVLHVHPWDLAMRIIRM